MNRREFRPAAIAALTRRLQAQLWPFHLFENVNRGSFFERAAALRRNRSKRRQLPGYTVKWVLVFGCCLGLLFLMEALGQGNPGWTDPLTWLAAGVGLLATLAFVVVVKIIALYLLLSCWDP